MQKKIALYTGGTLAVLGVVLPSFASAQNVVASTTEILSPLLSDALGIVGYVLGAVLTIALIVIGVGFGWRLMQRKITGKKL